MDQELMHASQQLAATIGGALAAKPLLERLLGPSFDYVGHSMAALLERFGNQNLMGIFKRTAAKLADVPKPVDARVLRAVIEDGSFADDAAAQEYFAGLLAASMANDVDDAALTFLSIVRSLTHSQLRLHHLVYSSVLEHWFSGASFHEVGQEPRVFLADDVLMRNDVSIDRAAKEHVVAGLLREGLISTNYELNVHYVSTHEQVGHWGMAVSGSPLGAQLFLWVHGLPLSAADDLLRRPLQIDYWTLDEDSWSLSGQQMDVQREAIQLIEEALSKIMQNHGYVEEVALVQSCISSLKNLKVDLPAVLTTRFEPLWSAWSVYMIKDFDIDRVVEGLLCTVKFLRGTRE